MKHRSRAKERKTYIYYSSVWQGAAVEVQQVGTRVFWYDFYSREMESRALHTGALQTMAGSLLT